MRDTLTRRQAIGMLGAGTGLAAIAACAPSTTAGPSATQADQTPVAGGKITVGRTDDLQTLDGHRFVSSQIGMLYGTVFDRLTRYDNDLNAKPMLAESWELSANGLQFKFNLRKGVTWHSGRDFTSEDVAWNLERIKDPKVGNGSYYNYRLWWNKIETPDKNTIIFHSESPKPMLNDFLVQFNIVDKSTIADPKVAVGTGPFTFVEWKQGQYIRFKKNPSFWRSGRPYLDEIEFQITADPQALVLRLESGSNDVVSDPPLAELGRLKTDPAYGSILINPGYYGMTPNALPDTKAPALKIKEVRQALSVAIDRKRFSETIMKGFSDPVNLPWPPYSEAYEKQKQAVTTFDLDKAKSLLTKAGVSSLELEFLYRSDQGELAQFAQVFQADLAKIGVKLTLKGVEPGVYTSQTNVYNYQLSSGTGAGRQYMPSTALFYGEGRPDGTFGYVGDPKLRDQIVAELDPAKRKTMLAQNNDLVLEQARDITYGYTQRASVFRKNIRGLVRGIVNLQEFADAWIAK